MATESDLYFQTFLIDTLNQVEEEIDTCYEEIHTYQSLTPAQRYHSHPSAMTCEDDMTNVFQMYEDIENAQTLRDLISCRVAMSHWD
jgi:hypothetical protein